MLFVKMAQLNIVFENLNKFYFEGEIVKVKLEVDLDKSYSVNYVIGNFVGLSSYVTVDEQESNMTSKLVSKTPTDIHFDEVFPLFMASTKESSIWEPGVREFNFEFQLPLTLPSSVESSHGYIRYSVHVTAELNEQIQKNTEHFTVISKTDLKNDVSAHLPIVLWKPENHCFLQELICKTGFFRAFFHIAKRGYVPGESILINAEICNFYRFPIEWIKASLIQIVKPSCGNYVKEKRVVTEITRGCILPFETQTWRSECMAIPAIPPTTYSRKRLIKVKYRLSFQLKPSWKRKPLELKQKIMIGAAGVIGRDMEKVECGHEEQGQGEGEIIYNSKYFNESNLEPCVFGPHSIKDDEDKCSVFSPLYPMYIVL